MRIVYICQQNPWRLNGGALIRNYWFIRALGERYPLDLITADDPREDVPPAFSALCTSISRFPRPRGRAAAFGRLAGMLRPGASYYTSGSVTAPMRAKVRGLARGGNAIAIVDLSVIDAVRNLRAPIVYQAHNAESDHLRRRAASETSTALRAFVGVDAARLRRIERATVRRARAVIACSAADRDDLARLADDAVRKILIAPNGVDLERYAGVAARHGDGKTVLITGSYDWRPNVVGLTWFIDEVLPVLQRIVDPNAFHVRVAGRMSAGLAAKIDALPLMSASPNPADMRSELQTATLVAGPIRSSSGTRLRILEAWGARRPVVTTTAGAFGLEHTPGVELAVADDPTSFARRLVSLMDDAPGRAELVARAFERVQDYAWPVILRRFMEESAPILESNWGVAPIVAS